MRPCDCCWGGMWARARHGGPSPYLAVDVAITAGALVSLNPREAPLGTSNVETAHGKFRRGYRPSATGRAFALEARQGYAAQWQSPRIPESQSAVRLFASGRPRAPQPPGFGRSRRRSFEAADFADF